MDQSYLLLKIKLDEEIIKVEERIKMSQPETQVDAQPIGGEVQKKREEWERNNKLNESILVGKIRYVELEANLDEGSEVRMYYLRVSKISSTSVAV